MDADPTPRDEADHVHDWQCVICGDQHPSQAGGLDVARWIDSLHEDVHGTVWTTKAELRQVLRATPSPSLRETNEIGFATNDPFDRATPSPDLDPDGDRIKDFDYETEGLGGT